MGNGCGLWHSLGVQRRLFLALMVACGATAACSRPEPMACKPPRSYWQKPHNFDGLTPIMNQISLTHDGSIYWNGSKLSSERLSEYLRVSHGLNPQPNHFLQTEMGVSCKALEALRDRMDQALECKKAFSHCAEGILSVWRELPTPPGTPIS